MPDAKPRIYVDFDGTIIEDGHWPEMGPVIPGCAYSLRKLAEHFEIVVYTCRTAPTMPDGEPRTEEDKHRELKAIHDVMVGLGLGWVEIWQKPHKPDGLIIDNNVITFTTWGQVLVEVYRRKKVEGIDGSRQLVLFTQGDS